MIEYIACPNCGEIRPVEDGLMLACPICGDDDTEEVDPEEVP